MHFYLEDVTEEELTEVADAAAMLVQAIRRHLATPGLCSGPGKMELTEAALRLERTLNPDKLKFDDPRRISIRPKNWPIDVWSDLRDIRHHFDNLIVVCGWKDLSDGPSPLRSYEPIPLSGCLVWPTSGVDEADVQKIDAAAARLRTTISRGVQPEAREDSKPSIGDRIPGKIHLPLSGNSCEQLRARIAIVALAFGVKNLPQEVEVDAFAELARTIGLAECWEITVGFPLPANRTEWFALLARGRIPAALFVEEKIRPREVLAYVSELEGRTMPISVFITATNITGYLTSIRLLRSARARLEAAKANCGEMDDEKWRELESALGDELNKATEGIIDHGTALHRYALAAHFRSDTEPLIAVAITPMDGGAIGRAMTAFHWFAVEREARESQRASRTAQGGALTESDSPANAPARHSGDFTSVCWFGEEYRFALGVQSSAVKALWDEWEKSGLGLHQDTIRNAIDPERDTFRMDKAFRGHPALGTMITKVGDGNYRLNEPGKGGPTAPAGPKKSPRIPAKARRKPR